jgi:hypothetical protein
MSDHHSLYYFESFLSHENAREHAGYPFKDAAAPPVFIANGVAPPNRPGRTRCPDGPRGIARNNEGKPSLRLADRWASDGRARYNETKRRSIAPSWSVLFAVWTSGKWSSPKRISSEAASQCGGTSPRARVLSKTSPPILRPGVLRAI